MCPLYFLRVLDMIVIEMYQLGNQEKSRGKFFEFKTLLRQIVNGGGVGG